MVRRIPSIIVQSDFRAYVHQRNDGTDLYVFISGEYIRVEKQLTTHKSAAHL